MPNLVILFEENSQKAIFICIYIKYVLNIFYILIYIKYILNYIIKLDLHRISIIHNLNCLYPFLLYIIGMVKSEQQPTCFLLPNSGTF